MATRTLTFALVVGLAVTALPAAQTPTAQTPTAAAQAPAFPATPPAPGTPRDFTVPSPKRFTLDNGLQVAFVEWGSLPKVTVTLAVDAGNVYETASQVWLADLTGELMQQGTASRSASEVSTAAARMGGSLNIGVGPDTATVGGDVLSEFAAPLIELVADVVRNPKLPEGELPRLKADLVRNIALGRSQPGQLALEKFRAVMYPDHSYGRVFPTEEMIKGYTLAQVQAFHTSAYAAGRARLYVVGRFDAAAAEAAVRKAFAGWAKGQPAAAPAAKAQSKRAIYLIDRPGAPQSTLLIGMPVIDPSQPNYVPLQVMNALLGGSFGSRITRNIREDKGYTYSPSSALSARRRDAYWAESADVTTAATGPSIKEILGEIDRLQAEPPSAEELRGIQNYLAGTYVIQNSSRGGITGQLAYMDLHGLPADYASQYVKRVYAVTPQQISELARQQIQDDQAIIVVVGDRKAITDQLQPFGTIMPQ